MISTIDDVNEFEHWLFVSSVQIWPNWIATEPHHGMQNGVTWFPKGSFIDNIVTNSTTMPLTKEMVITHIIGNVGLHEKTRARIVNMGGVWLLTFISNQSTGSIYTLNLDTLQPTKNSKKQDQLPFFLKQEVVKHILPLATMEHVESFNKNL